MRVRHLVDDFSPCAQKIIMSLLLLQIADICRQEDIVVQAKFPAEAAGVLRLVGDTDTVSNNFDFSRMKPFDRDTLVRNPLGVCNDSVGHAVADLLPIVDSSPRFPMSHILSNRYDQWHAGKDSCQHIGAV